MNLPLPRHVTEVKGDKEQAEDGNLTARPYDSLGWPGSYTLEASGLEKDW